MKVPPCPFPVPRTLGVAQGSQAGWRQLASAAGRGQTTCLRIKRRASHQHTGPWAQRCFQPTRGFPSHSALFSAYALWGARTVQRRDAHYIKLIKEWDRKRFKVAEQEVHKSKLDSLFYPLNQSPIPLLRSRGAQVEKYGSCPVCVADHPNDEDARRRPAYYCADCGFPTHCSHEHYVKGLEDHAEICEVLKQVNEDEHDMRSGRTLNELEMQQHHDDQYPVNFTNWHTFIKTNQLPGFDEDEEFPERSVRHLSKVLTYPLTAASLLYKQSPFAPLYTSEGYKSMMALGHTLQNKPIVSDLPMRQQLTGPRETVRVFVINPRGEASLPQDAWLQLQLLFPKPAMQIHFVGPHVPVTKDLPNDRCITAGEPLTLHYHQTSWTGAHAEKVAPFDLYRDVFFLFHPGFGHPTKFDEMRSILWQLLDTKCAVFCTAFNEEDLERDVSSLQEEDVVDEIDWLLKPTVNPFRSFSFEYDILDVRNLAQINWSVYGIRGKRYEVTYPKDDLLHHLLR